MQSIHPSGERLLRTDRELLTLAIRNLHENAVHHMPETGSVRWSTATSDNELAIFVEDEGPGIPDDEIAFATNRFFRGRHKSAMGSGLGLSIVELALKASGARLDLQNRSDRSGLRAQIIWPIARVAQQSDATSEYIHGNAPLRLRAAS